MSTFLNVLCLVLIQLNQGGRGEVDSTPLPPYTEVVNQVKQEEEESSESSAGKLLRKLTSKQVDKKKTKKEEKEEVVEFKLVEDLRLITIPVTTCLLILITYIIFGAVLFAAWEGWNYMDGAYFCFTSLMTIGFGDFVPGNKYIYNVGDNVTEQVLSLPLTLYTATSDFYRKRMLS